MPVPAILSFSKILQWPYICCTSLIETKPIYPKAITYPYRAHKCNFIQFSSPVHFCSYIYSPVCGLILGPDYTLISPIVTLISIPLFL